MDGTTGVHSIIPRLLHFRDLHPSKPAMVTFDKDFKRSQINFDELVTKASRFAHVLRSAGYDKYDVIANTLPVSIERFITDVGIMMAGAVGVGVKATLATGESFYSMLNRCHCKGVIVSPDLDCTEWKLLKGNLVQGSKTAEVGLTCQSISAPGVHTVMVVTRHQGSSDEFPDIPDLMTYLDQSHDEYICDVAGDDPAYIFFTSGSTGLPKLLVRSHSLLLYATAIISDVIAGVLKGFGYEDDLVLWNNHSFDLLAGFPSLVFNKGSTNVALDQMSPRPEDVFKLFWPAMAECGVVVAHLIAIEIQKLDESKSDAKFRLPLVFVGGMPMTESVVRTTLNFATLLGNHYGSGEMGSVSYSVVSREEQFVPGDVGHLVNGCQVRIVDDKGESMKEEKPGHIEVLSKWLVRDYFGDPGQGRKVYTQDGWYKSGDMGYMTSRGRLMVMGRSDDTIKYGPYTIFPTAIERILVGCPGVDKVVVVPIPDPVTNHKLCACAIKSTNGSDIQSEGVLDFMRGQLSDPPNPYTPVPHFILFVSSFPVISYSKVDRKRLVKIARNMLEEKNML